MDRNLPYQPKLDIYLSKTGKYECIEAKLIEDNVSMALQTHIDSLPYVQIFLINESKNV